MKRLIWLCVFVAAAWAGYEVHTKGIEGAFGGALAGKLDPLEPSGSLTVSEEEGQ